MKTRENQFLAATDYPRIVVEGQAAWGLDPSGFYARLGKSVFDRVTASVLLVLASPVLLAVTFLVALSLGRPILLRQERVGLGGRTFGMLKFRTMEPDRRVAQRPFPGPDRRVTHKTDRDPRHTPVGRVLRRLSLDELPQLWNVVRGDMSLVGPRPELTHLVERYEPWQHQRHLVRPGLTGLWQTTARGTGMLTEFVHLDLEYIRKLSMRNDLVLLLRTVPVLLRPRSF